MPHLVRSLVLFFTIGLFGWCGAVHHADLLMPDSLFPDESSLFPDFARKLPGYWHDHIKKLQIGLQREDTFESISDHALFEHFDSFLNSISGVCLYVPPMELSSTVPLVFVTVHGTWARGSTEFYHLHDPVFQATLGFAKELAIRHARPVEVVSFEWEGEDTPQSRESGGADLRNLIEAFYAPAYGYGPVWGYAHSHGGNVFNIASRDVCFDTLLYCGTPVHEMYRPVKVKRTLLLYSTNDPVQKAGSFDRRTWGTFFSRKSDGRVYEQQEDRRIINVRLQFDGKGPAHLSLKWVLPQLWGLIDTIDQHYEYHTNLDANIYSKHSLEKKHSLESQYPDSIVIIREHLKLHEVLPRIDQGDSGMRVVQQLSNELAYSESQERLFSAQYSGRSIHDGDSLLSSLIANWHETVDVIKMYVPWLTIDGCRGYSLLDDITYD